MASLVPCTACRRHVRRHESHCRFCGAELVPAAASAREVPIPRDVKRATILALGLTLAGQACGGQSDTPSDVPVYGAPPLGVGASGGAGGSNGSSGSGGSSNNGGAANTAGNAGSSSIQPVYGAPVFPQPGVGGSAGSSNLPDGSAPPDAGNADSGAADSGTDAGN